MTAAKTFRMSSIVHVVAILLLGTSLNQAYAQDLPETHAAAQISLSGWFSILWGDSEEGKSSTNYTLTDVNGQRTLLQLDETLARGLGGILKANREYVTVSGTADTPPDNSETSDSTESAPAALSVISISVTPPPGARAPTSYAVPAFASSGLYPWVTIMCKFSDIGSEPNDVAYFQGMYGDTQPGLHHYWKEVSLNAADIAGSTVGGTGWYTLPHTELYYNPTDTEEGTNRFALADDCIAEADADVDFSPYWGINLMFNSDFDNGWATGGFRYMTLDGASRFWGMTWEPPWAYADVAMISHEMGHGLGLPHSSYDRAAVYDNAWDVMSNSWYNCAAATDPTYGCMAQHTISYHKDMLGWIPEPQRTTVAVGASATVTLEDLAAPTSTNHQMVKIPIGGSATNFYTVEARKFTGYDAKLPDEAVIIHNIDSMELIPAALVPGGLSSTDPAVRWTAGEIFTDTMNDIAVIVNAGTGTGFEVTISNGNLPPTSEAGGPYTEECTGSVTTVSLDGSGSSDPEGSDLTYLWSTACNGTFDDTTLAQPTLTVNTSTGCGVVCSVSLTVTDEEGLSDVGDSAVVTILHTTRACDDGVDNDGDGLIDYPEDPGCENALSDLENPQCQDGVNNDGDPLIDFDGGQSIWGDCTGFACVPPATWPDCGCPPEVSDVGDDGIANPDGDCVKRPWKDYETSSPPGGCGLGTELPLLLPPLMWMWRRRRRSKRLHG